MYTNPTYSFALVIYLPAAQKLRHSEIQVHEI